MLYIGVDLGTSACKFLLVDEQGRVLNTVSKTYPLSLPRPGWSEQAPEDWWAACLSGIPELLHGFCAGEVAAIGVGGQMHGLVALDSRDNALRPAILWNDSRTSQETEYLNSVVGRGVLSARTANIAFAGFTAPKLLWMKKNEPELFRRIARVMLPKDYLVYRMTGVHATDFSDASGTLLLDVKNKCWHPDMLALCGISENQMPALYPSYAPVAPCGRMPPARWGWPEIPWYVRARAITPRPQLGQAPWATAGAISRLARQAQYSFHPLPSGQTRTMRCTPLPMQTAAGI